MLRSMLRRTPAIAALAVLSLSALAVTTHAADTKWMVRLRAVDLLMQNKSDAGSGALTPALLPADAVTVNDKIIPDVDVSYFFTPNLAAELVLTYPQEQKVKIENGPLKEDVGTFKHLPPTLTLQYHFTPKSPFQPYVGAGVNLTLLSDVKLHSTPGATDLGLDSNSIGAAGQIGADYNVKDNWFVNVDVKKVFIHSDVTISDKKVSHASIDPFLIGVGVGIRF